MTEYLALGYEKANLIHCFNYALVFFGSGLICGFITYFLSRTPSWFGRALGFVGDVNG